MPVMGDSAGTMDPGSKVIVVVVIFVIVVVIVSAGIDDGPLTEASRRGVSVSGVSASGV